MIGAVATFVAAPLAPEKLFSLGPIPITNSMLTGLVSILFVLVLFGAAAKASQLWPKSRLAFFVESVIELVYGMLLESFGDDKKARRHFPLLASLLIFILIGNLSGLLPGIETIKYIHNGHSVSLFRSWTTDLNSTLALAVLALSTVHYYAVKEIGWKGYARHFFAGKLYSPMTWFIGLNELFGEVLRLVTLSLRLFGVIYGGEALLFAITDLAGNFGWAASLPIMFLEIFVCLVQAYLFMMLTTSYIVMSTTHGEQDSDHAAPALASSA